MDELVYRFIKFGVVGFSGVCIDFFFTWLLKEKFRINKYVANSVGFVVAASSNYIWNRVWTFESHNSEVAREYFLFLTIALVGLIINNFVIFLLNEKLRFNFYFSKLLAIGVVTFWNFGMNYWLTF